MLDAGAVSDDVVANLKLALRIELSVIPPYLYALWSVRPPAEGAGWAAAQASASIRAVVYEEMLHAALLVNLLHALGTKVDVLEPMSYPGVLPGHVTTGPNAFVVTLRPLDRSALSVFTTIEQPDFGAPSGTGSAAAPSGWVSLADFYGTIRTELEALTDADFRGGGQIQPSGNPGAGRLVPVTTKATALEAVETILDQGEGTGAPTPIDPTPEDDDDHEVAHYYQFLAIDGYLSSGAIVPARDLYPVVPDPRVDLYTAEQRAANAAFNTTYQQMLLQLVSAFGTTPAQPFGPPTQSMLRLTQQAAWLRSLGPVPGAQGQSYVAGPTFEPSTEAR